MIKKITRIMLMSFFLVIIIVGNSVNMPLLAMFGCFWLGFVISAIVAKEQENLASWAAMRGVPIDMFLKEKKKEDDKDENKHRREA